MFRSSIVLVLASVAVLVVAPAIPASAVSVTRTPLPFASFYSMSVDEAHGEIFASGGPGTTGVAVFDQNAALLEQIPVSGASGTVLVGSELFVAAADAPSIAVIDTTASPPSVARTIDITPFFNPQDLAYVSGRLWFFADTDTHQSLLVSVNTDGSGLSDGQVISALSPVRFATGLAGGTTLYMFDQQSLYAYDATTIPATFLHTRLGPPGYSGNIADVALMPDGASLVFESLNPPYTFPELATSDFSLIRNYAASPYPTAVATSSTYGGLFAGGSYGFQDPDVRAYHVGQTQAFWSFDFHSDEIMVAPHGEAWSADGYMLFVVTTTTTGKAPAFSVLYPPSSATETSSVAATATPSHFLYGTSTTLSFHLSGGDTNRTLDVYATPYEQPTVLLTEGTVDASGNLTLAYQPSANTRVIAYFDGDHTWLPSSDGVHLWVQAKVHEVLQGATGRVGRYDAYRAGTDPVAQTTVSPDHGGLYVGFKLQALSSDGWQRVDHRTVQLDANSSAAVAVRHAQAGVRYRIATHFSGGDNVGGDSRWRYFFVRHGLTAAKDFLQTGTSLVEGAG